MTSAGTTRLVRAMMAADRAGILRYAGMSEGGTRFAVDPPHSPTRLFDTAGMWAWLRGFETGRSTAAAKPIRQRQRRPLPELRAVLVEPSLADACRIAILAAMEDAGLDNTSLSERIGRTRKAISDALRFGRAGALSLTMAEQMMTGTGRRWDIRYARLTDDAGSSHAAPIAPVDQAPPEPAGLRRARAVALFHDRGLIRLVTPTEPNQARRAGMFVVDRAGALYKVKAAAVVPWLTGLGDAVDPETAAAINTGQ